MQKIIYLLLFLILNSTIVEAQNLTTGAAINKAGRQRMLTQRMAKDYLSIGAGIKVEEAARELDEASSMFNESLRDLEIYSKNKETTDALNFVSMLWAKFRLSVLSTPDVETAGVVITDANNLMNACNVVTERIVASSGIKTAILPNISGKQRMYSQKIAMLYIANHWGVNYKTLSKELDDAINSFDDALTILVNTPENTDDINKILKFQQSEWKFLQKSFDLKEVHSLPATIFSSTNMILKDFDRATVLYEKVVK
jgi:nitrate/nitrite-specific signal transduction histidine kinase